MTGYTIVTVYRHTTNEHVASYMLPAARLSETDAKTLKRLADNKGLYLHFRTILEPRICGIEQLKQDLLVNGF